MSEYTAKQARAYIQAVIHPTEPCGEKTYTANELRRLMRRYRLVQTDIAKLLDVSQVSVSKWLRGVSEPTKFHSAMLREIEEGTFGFPLMTPASVGEAMKAAKDTDDGHDAADRLDNLARIYESYTVAYNRLKRMGLIGRTDA